MITLLLMLVIVALVTLLSVQNAMPVVVSLLYWEFQVSLAIILVLSVLAGVIIGAIAASHFKKKPIKIQQPLIIQEKEGVI